MLHYFCVQGLHDVAGYLSSRFWSRTVLQTSYDDPVVRQALISLSSLHLDCTNSDVGGSVSNDILIRHGKTLRALRRRIETGTTDAIKTALVCCILFYCFESTLGNSEAAMQHLRNGINILYSPQHTFYGHGKDQDVSAVSAVLERLRIQAAVFYDSTIPVTNPELDKQLQTLKNLPSETSVFERIEDAHHALVKLQSWLFQFLDENLAFKGDSVHYIPLDVQNEKRLLVERFAIWDQRFEPLKTSSVHDNQAACGSKVLLIHWQVSNMLLASDHPHDASVFSVCPNTRAERIVQLAEDVLRATKERTMAAAPRSHHRNFSSETGVVAPLFILAMKCSDKSICERATDLLLASQRREGLFDSQAMASIVRSLRTAQSQKIIDGSSPDAVCTHQSLESTFTEEIDKVTGGLDKVAIFVNPVPSNPMF